MIFNPSTITETNKITNIVSVIDSNGNSLLNDFLSKTGDTIEGTLQIDGNDSKLIFPNGSVQEVAFDEGYVSQLDHIITVAANMSVDNDVLLIDQDVVVSEYLILLIVH